ncbi:toxin-antitoxin system YwqK family antitoxin [Flavobacterium agrisoli]|uniref:Antitoxin component YwqK of YwqJK toxin-antitoxin module n=1 Tax=Flavobacterium agrisoli TaxID=2793066 RepID=A0A934UJ65_9FLAO|nr:hypothetical protein [Flavobacterium agrisoli]MBK0369153.1 hypothetical protein [Flavobacterium agrisoli]
MFQKKMMLFVLGLTCMISWSQNELNRVDAKGLKEGLWRGTYEVSKRPRYEGVFSHGKETGVFKYFDDTKKGDVIATRDFSANDGSAYVIFYDQSKNKVSEGKVVNKLFEGPWVYYHHASSTIMSKETYVKGKLEGTRVVFYPDGKIAEEQNYKAGLKDGLYKKYAENGIVLEESNFKGDVYHGDAIFRDGIGNIASKGTFLNGKKAGIWEFYEKGKLAKEVNMSDPKAISQSFTKSKVSPEQQQKPKK